MKRFSFLFSLLLVLALLFSGCSIVTVVDTTAADTDETEQSATEPSPTEPSATSDDPVTTAEATTEPITEPITEPTTTAEPEPEPEPLVTLGTHLKTVPDDPYTPTPYATQSDKYTDKIVQKKNAEAGAKIVNMPSRTGVTYQRRLPAPANLAYASSRDELVKIVNWYAFYRESGVSVKLGYSASSADDELNFLWRNSDLLASQCALYGTLQNSILTVNLKFYPESYLAVPRYTTPAKYIAVETSAPTLTETFPGLDPEHGVSVWDSEQMAYALSRGYAVSPIEGSPAAALAAEAQSILSGIVDDTMTEFRIAYRVYRWLVENAAYDYAGDRQAGRSLDQAYMPDMIPARTASFRAEGPLLYGVGVCFGYAKAATVLLGLEGLDVRRVVSFSDQYLGWQGARYWVFDTIQVHSYNYLRIGEHDYLFDLSFAKDGKLQVRRSSDLSATDTVGATKDFCIGLSKAEQCTYYSEFPDDPYSLSSGYNPGSFHYLSEITYDGTHSLLLSTQAEAQAYYDYLLANVFSGAADYRTVTLFFADGAYSQAALNAFLSATGVPFKTAEKNASATRTDAVTMVQIAFGK